MGQIKWYKRNPDAALSGMMELTLEERGAYNTVLDLIYARDGNLPDDDRFIAGWLRVDIRVWKRIKITLIERKKLFIEDGIMRNERADVEVLMALSRVLSAREAGLTSARSKASKSGGKTKKNSDLGSTTVGTTVSTPVSTNKNQSQREESNDSSLVTRPRAKTKSNIPDDWTPEEFSSDTECAKIIGHWSEKEFRLQVEHFTAHHRAKGNQFADWQRAWQTWILNNSKWSNGNDRQNYRTPDSQDGAIRELDRQLGFDDPAGEDRRYDLGDRHRGSPRAITGPRSR